MTTLEYKTYAELLDEHLAKLRNKLSDISTGQASEARIRAEVESSILEGLYQYLKWTVDQRFPSTANLANLIRHAEIREIEQLDPTTSSGQITVTGSLGSTLLTGSQFEDASGLVGETTADVTIGAGGEETVAAVSVDTGTAVNWADGEKLTLLAPPAGIDAEAEADGDFTGGTDIEAQEHLLGRYLDQIRQPPAGGTSNDWKQWAEAVDGVLHAWSHPLRRGVGTIDVSIVTEGVGGHVDLPGAPLVSAVEDALEENRPVTSKDFEVVTPTKLLQATTVDDLLAGDGYDEATVKAAVEEAIPLFYDLIEAGESLYRVALIYAIKSVAGVENFVLTSPAADVVPVVDSTKVEMVWCDAVTVNLA